ncbi:MAG: prepilin-type N-terminal cleavage/methylation domain-containing protein [Synergistaceae bacterium]|jgi:prepilin-type N-terminal cleavage/methylation domain-containing protein|nr:prepilin-type N-terminal cleavage/methylation domain-containing protein [Synergistaceae bacterium]
MKRPGFSLVELLIALLLGSAVSIIVFQTTRTIVLSTARVSNNALAWERGQSVLSILEPRVLHAGFGVPCEPAGNILQRSFGGGTGRMNVPPPAEWSNRGPLQIWRGFPSDESSSGLWDLAPETSGVFRGKGLAVLYAVPSGASAKIYENRPLLMEANVPVTVKLVSRESLQTVGDRLQTTKEEDLRSWVTFPLMGFPVYVSSYQAGELKIRLAEGSGLSAELRPYDEMHYLRGERFLVKNDSLYSEELHTSWVGSEPRVEGVLEMWFQWMPSASKLEAWILTTGGEAVFGKSSRPREWPAEAPWSPEFELHDVTVVRGSWILKNLGS